MLDDRMELIENDDHASIEMDNIAHANVAIPVPASVRGEWRVRAVCLLCDLRHGDWYGDPALHPQDVMHCDG